MKNKAIRYSGALLVIGFLFANAAQAFNFGNMFNPSKWGNNDRYDDDYYDDYRGGPGYGYGPPPGMYGAPGYGYGGPGYGYGVPGYGVPGYTVPGQAAANQTPQGYNIPDYNVPDTHSGQREDAAEIERLKERIRMLEDANRQTQPYYGGQQGAGMQPSYGGAQPYGGQRGYQGNLPPIEGRPGVQGYGGQQQYQFRPLEQN